MTSQDFGWEVQMKKPRFTESQIVGILKEADGGVAVEVPSKVSKSLGCRARW
jgi:hypothetical protein